MVPLKFPNGTTGTTVPGKDKVTRSYVHGGLWGLARTFRMEERNVSLRSGLQDDRTWWACLKIVINRMGRYDD